MPRGGDEEYSLEEILFTETDYSSMPPEDLALLLQRAYAGETLTYISEPQKRGEGYKALLPLLEQGAADYILPHHLRSHSEERGISLLQWSKSSPVRKKNFPIHLMPSLGTEVSVPRLGTLREYLQKTAAKPNLYPDSFRRREATDELNRLHMHLRSNDEPLVLSGRIRAIEFSGVELHPEEVDSLLPLLLGDGAAPLADERFAYKIDAPGLEICREVSFSAKVLSLDFIPKDFRVVKIVRQ